MLTSRDIQLINEAIANQVVVKFGYRAANDSFSMRNVEPYEVKGGMLWAWDRDREATRSFSLDRMQGVITTGIQFDKREF